MKNLKIKFIMIALISVIFISLMCIWAYGDYVDLGGEYFEGEQFFYICKMGDNWNGWKKYYAISFASVLGNEKLYCVEKSDSWPRISNNWMQNKYRVEFDGDTAYFYQYDDLRESSSLIKKYEGIMDETWGVTDNALMASILYNGTGYGSMEDAYTDSQKALYYYGGTWVSRSGAPFSIKGSDDPSYKSCVTQYANLAKSNKYKVKLYYFIPSNGARQNGIYVTGKEPVTQNINIPVKKEWLDGEYTSRRPSEIKVQLLADGKNVEGKILTLNASNEWSGKFENLPPKNSSGSTIQYTVKEVVVPNDYTVHYFRNDNNDITKGFTIKNRLKTKVTVKKVWDDDNNSAGIRPESIVIKLYNAETGAEVTCGGTEQKQIILDGVVDEIETSPWTGTFDYELCNGGLGKYDPKTGALKVYSVREEGVPEVYEVEYSEPVTDEYGNTTITITNKYKPEYDGYIEITGKVWEDLKDAKDSRYNGVYDYSQIEGEHSEKGLEGIRVTLKDASGAQFDEYSTATTATDGTYTIKVNRDTSRKVYKLISNPDGDESVKSVEERLKTAYVEFKYDGLTYTTVANASTGINTSKAIEDDTRRKEIDERYSEITSTSPTKEEVAKNIEYITAVTRDNIKFEDYQKIAENMGTDSDDVPVRYCDGTNYEQTNPNGAWKPILSGESESGHDHTKCSLSYPVEVKIIKNVNLGLMRREQPALEVNEELSQVEVEMNRQNYTYIYKGVEEIEKNEDNVKVQFQGDIGENNGLYVYRRPVNPSNVAEVVNNKGTMNVFVTYEVKVSNSADSLISKVNSITNYFDKEYTLVSATIGGNNITSNISNETDFNKATLSGLNIQLNPHETSAAIELRYEVSQKAIKDLLNEEATLSNAVEIESYSTYYGETTLYAEQRTSGRTGNPYGAYDKDSHPGNAGIHLEQVDFTYTYYGKETIYDNQNILVATVKEPDTDIAPSFLLYKDEIPKTLSGTVFEDTDVITNDNERLGNGKYDSSEKNVQNVKVELYEIITKEDGTTETKLATLYDKNGNEISNDEIEGIGAIQYTSDTGTYAFNGVVTGKEYYVKFTYGDDESVLAKGRKTKINGVEPAVNARNYKSTIISDEKLKVIMQSNAPEFNKYWYKIIGDNNSVAVDNMLDRLEIEDLQYSNFHKKEDGSPYVKPENMTAYSKSFITPVEFVDNDEGKVQDGSGSIEGITNNCSKFNFGIIERPREDLFVEKTISNIKITLANGQKLLDGDPRTEELNYVKAMGFKDDITNSSLARKVGNKRLLAELDAELTQGAQLDIEYQVKVTNHNEIDYDYGILDYYKNDIKPDENKYMATKPENRKYYYYYYYGNDGEIPADANILNTKIQLVDYISSNIVYEENANWEKIDVETLHQARDAQLISNNVYDEIKGKYIVLQPAEAIDNTITLERSTSVEDKSKTFTMKASKVLTSQAENVYNNHVEIIRIDGKTARTIQYADGVLKEKTYYPGNYAPGLSVDEQDDDGAEVIVTPPTGIIDIIIYVVAGLIGLIVIAGGIIFIKKKVLTK